MSAKVLRLQTQPRPKSSPGVTTTPATRMASYLRVRATWQRSCDRLDSLLRPLPAASLNGSPESPAS